MGLKFGLMFLLGFISCAFIFFLIYFIDFPVVTGFVGYDFEVSNNWVMEKDVVVFDDKVVLRIDNATLSNYEGNSMGEIFGGGAKGIRVVPKGVNEINVGDIVSYRFYDKLIVHRVIEKGFDEDGVYFIVKGDNNLIVDEKVRLEDIEYVTIGVIW